MVKSNITPSIIEKVKEIFEINKWMDRDDCGEFDGFCAMLIYNNNRQ